jgi:glycosyltransferase involved in cell wall biosynthesis
MIGVVVISYQQAHYLPNALASLLEQTHRQWQAWIVCGDDPSFVAAGPWCSDVRIDRVREHEARGIGPARNLGVLLLRGCDRLCMLDADDELAPTYLERCNAVLERDPGVAIAYTHCQCFGLSPGVWKCGPFTLSALWEANRLPYAALYRRHVWEAIGGYAAGDIIEDWDFWLSAAERGFRGELVDAPLFRYRVRSDGGLATARQHFAEHVERIRARHPRTPEP